MLTDVSKINQKQLKNIYRFGIRSGANILVLGPSGGGKTEMAQQVVAEENCELIYINLSVLERTDFQGMPVISEDKTSVTYATPEFLPFADVRSRNERSYLNTILSWLNRQDTPNRKSVNTIENRIKEIDSSEEVKVLQQALQFLEPIDNNLAKVIKNLKTPKVAEKPIVILFDEVDKGAHEVLQTLLEFLQFRSVNGRVMNVQTCFLTGNLPDEFANSAQISHAITKRCMTYKLELDFKHWREWAYSNKIHTHILGFLTQKSDYLHKGPPDGDPTAYALPSPRTWTAASKALRMLDDDLEFSKLRGDELTEFRLSLLGGCVGDIAAINFNNWLKYYRELDPIVDELVKRGVVPNEKKLDTQQIFLVALSACSQIYSELKPNNEDIIQKYTKNVFGWIDKLDTDIKMGTIRMAFGGDWNKIREYKLSNIPEFMKVFKEIKKALSDWDI